MTTFCCAGCGAVLTVPLIQMPQRAAFDNDVLGVLMEPGTYTVNGAWPLWAEAGAGPEFERERIFAALRGTPGAAAILAPGDVHGVDLVVNNQDFGCCGAGLDLTCTQCGRVVGSRIDDCNVRRQSWLKSKDVRRAVPPDEVLDWAELPGRYAEAPPVDEPGYWSTSWPGEVAVTLAHLTAVSGGQPLTVAEGPAAVMFRPALNQLIPSGSPARVVTADGPGVHGPDADIALVPVHPQTGELWPHSTATDTVPLAYDVWHYLAFHSRRRPVPGAGAMPVQAYRDELMPFVRPWLFQPVRWRFLTTLETLLDGTPAWLRQIHTRVAQGLVPALQ